MRTLVLPLALGAAGACTPRVDTNPDAGAMDVDVEP